MGIYTIQNRRQQLFLLLFTIRVQVAFACGLGAHPPNKKLVTYGPTHPKKNKKRFDNYFD
jgi:hypothetical protein